MLLWRKSSPVWENNRSRQRTVRPPSLSCSPLQKQVSPPRIYPGTQQEPGLQLLPKSPQGCERQPAAQTHTAFSEWHAAELKVQTGSRGKTCSPVSPALCSLLCSTPQGTSELSRAQRTFLLSVSANLSGSSTSISWRGTQGLLYAWRAATRVPGVPAPRPAPWDKQGRTLCRIVAQPRLLQGRQLGPSIDSGAGAAACAPGDMGSPALLSPSSSAAPQCCAATSDHRGGKRRGDIPGEQSDWRSDPFISPHPVSPGLPLPFS